MMNLHRFNPFDKEQHGVEDFQKITLQEQILTVFATITTTVTPIAFLGIISLPLFGLAGIATFRSLSAYFVKSIPTDSSSSVIKINQVVNKYLNQENVDKKEESDEETSPNLAVPSQLAGTLNPEIQPPVIPPSAQSSNSNDDEKNIADEYSSESDDKFNYLTIDQDDYNIEYLDDQHSLDIEEQKKLIGNLIKKAGESGEPSQKPEDAALIFHSEIKKQIKNLNAEEKFTFIETLLSQKEALTEIFKTIEKSSRGGNFLGDPPMLLKGETEADLVELNKWKELFFGEGLKQLIVNNAPIRTKFELKKWLEIIKDHYPKEDSKEIISSILYRIYDFCLDIYHRDLLLENDKPLPPKFERLSTCSFGFLRDTINFIQKEVKKGYEIKNKIFVEKKELDPLPMPDHYYDSFDVEEESDEDDEELVQNQSKNEIATEKIEKTSSESIDYLKKLAALYRIKEFTPAVLKLDEFKEMLEEANQFSGNIDENHPLFLPLSEQVTKMIERFNDEEKKKEKEGKSPFPTQELVSLQKFYNPFVKKFGQSELEITLDLSEDANIAFEIAVNLYMTDNPGINRHRAEAIIRSQSP